MARHHQEVLQAGIVQVLIENELAQHEQHDVGPSPVILLTGCRSAEGGPDDVLHGQRVELDLLLAEADAQRCHQPDDVSVRRRAPEAPPQGDIKSRVDQVAVTGQVPFVSELPIQLLEGGIEGQEGAQRRHPGFLAGYHGG
jgi:hypothetical protein